MTGFFAIARREVREHRVVLVAAAVASLGALAVPLLHARDVRRAGTRSDRLPRSARLRGRDRDRPGSHDAGARDGDSSDRVRLRAAAVRVRHLVGPSGGSDAARRGGRPHPVGPRRDCRRAASLERSLDGARTARRLAASGAGRVRGPLRHRSLRVARASVALRPARAGCGPGRALRLSRVGRVFPAPALPRGGAVAAARRRPRPGGGRRLPRGRVCLGRPRPHGRAHRAPRSLGRALDGDRRRRPWRATPTRRGSTARSRRTCARDSG